MNRIMELDCLRYKAVIMRKVEICYIHVFDEMDEVDERLLELNFFNFDGDLLWLMVYLC